MSRFLDYELNVWFREDDSTFCVLAFPLIIDVDGYLSVDTDNIVDRLDLNADSEDLNVVDAIGYFMGNPEWAPNDLFGVDEWFNLSEFDTPEAPTIVRAWINDLTEHEAI